MARYGLAQHVFVCLDEEYVVVLDLKQDRYFSLDAAKTAALGPVLPGWPLRVPAADLSQPQEAAQTDAVAEPLCRQGWLLEASAGKDATPVRLDPPETELMTDIETHDARIGARGVLGFLVTSIFAKLALRFCSFERVVRRVRQRRAAATQPLDIDRARQLVAAFRYLRVFLFSTREECLHDSFALLEFLARHGLFPEWVFAVRARPFAAHCWVQYDGIVFNDTVEHVSSYIPIMVV